MTDPDFNVKHPDGDQNPKKSEEQEVFSFSGNFVNYILVAIAFFAIGGFIGFSLAPKNDIKTLDIEDAVRRVLSDMDLGSGPTTADSRFDLVDDDAYIGAEDAPVVIVEFSAFACPYCGRHFNETLTPLLENYGDYIRYVYRDFPTINPSLSFPAAMAAECAHEQGKYWEFHNSIYSNQSRLGEPDFLLSIASDLDLDLESFQQCVDEERYYDEVNLDYLDGTINNVTGTPSFFINGQYISGAQPYLIFERMILRELEKAGIELPEISNEPEATTEPST
ncbi:hypothetical protein MASR2M15_08930 [Anaerolineales bacterium]